MSRSYRKNPIHGIAETSEKNCKRLYNRALRSSTRQRLNSCDDFDAVMLPEVRDVSNPWSMAKDGKIYSNSLAKYAATLAKVFITRQGRTRFLLTVTASTFERMEEERRESRPRWVRMGLRASFIDAPLTNRDLRQDLETLRK